MKLKKPAFISIACITGGCLINLASADAIRNVAGPVILDAFTDANPNIGTGTPSIALGSGNYNLPDAGNGNHPGRGVIIGENNKLSTAATPYGIYYGSITGGLNDIRVYDGMVVGNNNKMSSDQSLISNFGKFTSIFGISNVVYPGSQGAYASLVTGYNHRLTGDYTFLSGQGNIVAGPSLGSDTLNSVAMGVTNTIASETAWVIGQSNILSGKEASAYGKGLSAIHRGVTVLGSYNADPAVNGGEALNLRTDYFAGSPLLIIGNGNSSSSRSNALVVRRSGDVEVAGTILQGGVPLATQAYAQSISSSAIDNRLSGQVELSGGFASEMTSTAISGGYAVGSNSLAVANGTAMADYSVAFNGHAEGYASVAFGGHAKGQWSSALGMNSQALSVGSAVVGAGGYALGNESLWIETDTVFAVGNSLFFPNWDTSTPLIGSSNAITTLKNGQTTLTNKFWSSSAPLNIPTNATEASNGNALIVEGHSCLKGNTVMEGHTKMEGNTVMDGQVTITQVQGDINPGIYQ